MILEVIAFTISDCNLAQQTGADRIELCADPAQGGTNPSYGFIKAARHILDIDLFVMIRPRGGDFIYSSEEYKIMQEDIKVCKQRGCDGIVLGILDSDGRVDKARCKRLVELSYPLSVTFHRAFDRVADPFRSLEDIINIGCERILTSGQKDTAETGAELIKTLIQKAGDRIIIMPGSGIRGNNISSLAEKTGAREFHSSARINNKLSIGEIKRMTGK